MYQKGHHNTNVAIRVSSQRAAFASYIFFFDPAYNFVLYDRNYPWTYTSFHIFTNISQHSLFSFWVILSDFSDIVNLFYYDLTIFSAATVWSCPEGFLLHRGFHRNLLCNKKNILISKNAWIFILNLYIKDIPSKQHTRIFLHLLHFSLLWLKPRPISNSQLHTLPYFHLCPIYLVVFKGSYYLSVWEILSLGGLHA